MALDEVFREVPDYIMMDLESAEWAALSVSLYHRPSDLWELLLLIQRIQPSYQFYLRAYAHLGLELVLYCVPR